MTTGRDEAGNTLIPGPESVPTTMKAPPPDNEPERLATLRSLHILDTAPEQSFDELADLAASICQAPVALVSLVDEGRQWFKSRTGWATEETPRQISFCAHTILAPTC